VMRLPSLWGVAAYSPVELASIDLNMRSFLSQGALDLLPQLGRKSFAFGMVPSLLSAKHMRSARPQAHGQHVPRWAVVLQADFGCWKRCLTIVS
jgi:hypothetical protein